MIRRRTLRSFALTALLRSAVARLAKDAIHGLSHDQFLAYVAFWLCVVPMRRDLSSSSSSTSFVTSASAGPVACCPAVPVCCCGY